MNMYKCKNKDIPKHAQNILRPLFYVPSWANLYIFQNLKTLMAVENCVDHFSLFSFYNPK